MLKHFSPISGVAAYVDQYIATAGYDNKLILWDAKTQQALACGYHDHLVNQCQFSPCGKYVLSSSSDYSARLWSVPDMKLLAIFADHKDDVEGIAFHPNKLLIATVSRDHQLRVFDYQGNLLAKLIGHSRDVLSVAWINDDELLTSSDDGTVKRWSYSKEILLNEIDLAGVETDTIAISKNSTIFAGNDDGEIVVIKNSSRKLYKVHKSGIKKLSYSSDKNILVSLSYDRSFSIWQINDSDELELIRTALYPPLIWARSCAFSGADIIAFATFGSSYATYNYLKDQWQLDNCQETGGVNAVLSDQGVQYTIGDAGVLRKNGQKINQLPSLCNFIVASNGRLFTGGQTGELFDALTGETVYKHHSPLNCGAGFMRGTDNCIVIGAYTGEGIVLAIKPHSVKLIATIQLHNNAIKQIDIGNQQIFSVSATGAAAFHSSKNFKLLKQLSHAHDRIANGCKYVDKGFFASIGRDLTLRLTAIDAQEIIATPHKNSIKCLAVSANKKLIATGGYHGHIAIYDTENKTWYQTRPTDAGISSLTYDEQNQQFLASSYDSFVYSVGA